VEQTRAQAPGLWPKPFLAVLVALAFALTLASEAKAGSSLTPLEVFKLKDYLTVSTKLEGGFSETITQSITSGIPADFSYQVELWRQRKWWPDENVAKKSLIRTVSYNSLTGEYQVVQTGDVEPWEKTTRDLKEVIGWVAPLKALPLVHLSNLDPETPYYVRVRAGVKTEQSRSALKFLLFFISPFREKKTSWMSFGPFMLRNLETLERKSSVASP
jgi:hypothetical protein